MIQLTADHFPNQKCVLTEMIENITEKPASNIILSQHSAKK